MQRFRRMVFATMVGLSGCVADPAGEPDETGLGAGAVATPEGEISVSDQEIEDGVDTNWFGTIHVTVSTSTQYGGWVDGNGPDTYQAWAICNGGRGAQGVARWAGDRRQSIATCSNGIAPPSTGKPSRGFHLIERD